MDASPTVVERLRYELRFGFLFDAGRAFVFPCDASGRVDLASLTVKARENYLWACAAVGRELAMPAVLRR